MNRLSIVSRPVASTVLARTQGAYAMMAVRRYTDDVVPYRLFVGGLSWGTDENKLRESFAHYGEVKHVRVVIDRETGRSRGFGFVTFANSEDARRAAEALHEQELDGRKVSISFARQDPNRVRRNRQEQAQEHTGEHKEESLN